MTKQRLSTAKRKAAFIAALYDTLGNISRAAEKVGIERKTYYLWIDNDEKFRDKCNDVIEVEKDFAEARLRELMAEKNVTAVIFYLKTRAKDRGWTEKTTIELQNYDPHADPFAAIRANHGLPNEQEQDQAEG